MNRLLSFCHHVDSETWNFSRTEECDHNGLPCYTQACVHHMKLIVNFKNSETVSDLKTDVLQMYPNMKIKTSSMNSFGAKLHCVI